MAWWNYEAPPRALYDKPERKETLGIALPLMFLFLIFAFVLGWGGFLIGAIYVGISALLGR